MSRSQLPNPRRFVRIVSTPPVGSMRATGVPCWICRGPQHRYDSRCRFGAFGVTPQAIRAKSLASAFPSWHRNRNVRRIIFALLIRSNKTSQFEFLFSLHGEKNLTLRLLCKKSIAHQSPTLLLVIEIDHSEFIKSPVVEKIHSTHPLPVSFVIVLRCLAEQGKNDSHRL